MRRAVRRLVVPITLVILATAIALDLFGVVNLDLGDIASVWTWQAFMLAFVAGFGFGYLVIGSLSAQARWRTQNSPKAYGWITGVLAGWYLAAMVLSQVAASIMTGDFLWERALSRLFPYLVGALGTGIGVYRGLKRAEDNR